MNPMNPRSSLPLPAWSTRLFQLARRRTASRLPNPTRHLRCCLLFLLAGSLECFTYTAEPSTRTTRIALGLPAPEADDSAGGLLVADVNDDGRMDFLVTVPGHLLVVDNRGHTLWLQKTDIGVGGQSESQGLPGHHGPGVAVGDVDGDGCTEVVYLTRGDSVVHFVDGATGKPKTTAQPPVPPGAQRWELALLASFRGQGTDTDILYRRTNTEGYRMGRYLAAYAVRDLLRGGEPLWTTDQFVSCAHNGARLADLDGDGRDEVLGATIYSATGQLLVRAAPFQGHMDSVFVADVLPDRPGREVVLLEEGSNQVQLLGLNGPIWRNHLRGQEPQNAAIGRFHPDSDAYYIWCRSRYNEHQKPFVFDAQGQVVFEYEMDNVAPKDWTASGVEVIHTIDWTGARQQLACAKERHRSGDVALFEPLTGRFVQRFKTRADRLYVADVFGDWREEILVLEGSDLVILQNTAPNPRPNQPRLWQDRNYRRLKHCHNYYSP
ncbi:MAG: hypothetical protein FJ387_13170 [Verrucomicrobia bacterium]|nr:hypothetical protein [Verrucomicrobiota bacterium]